VSLADGRHQSHGKPIGDIGQLPLPGPASSLLARVTSALFKHGPWIRRDYLLTWELASVLNGDDL